MSKLQELADGMLHDYSGKILEYISSNTTSNYHKLVKATLQDNTDRLMVEYCYGYSKALNRISIPLAYFLPNVLDKIAGKVDVVRGIPEKQVIELFGVNKTVVNPLQAIINKQTKMLNERDRIINELRAEVARLNILSKQFENDKESLKRSVELALMKHVK